jgi:hypothetical protein
MFNHIQKAEYSWGTLRTSTDRRNTLVVHPEDAAKVESLAAGGEIAFNDEQRHRWIVTREEVGGTDAFVFYRSASGGHGRATFRFRRGDFLA